MLQLVRLSVLRFWHSALAGQASTFSTDMLMQPGVASRVQGYGHLPLRAMQYLLYGVHGLRASGSIQ